MLDFECPKCRKVSEIDGEDLPDVACDDTEWECQKCGYITKIGWFATVEER